MKVFLLRAVISLCLGLVAYIPISWKVSDYVVNAHLETLNRRIDDAIAQNRTLESKLAKEISNAEENLAKKISNSVATVTCKVLTVELNAQWRLIERKLFESVLQDLEPESQIISEISSVHTAYLPAFQNCELPSTLGWLSSVHNTLINYTSDQFVAGLSSLEGLPKTTALYHYLSSVLNFMITQDISSTKREKDQAADQAIERAQDAFRIAKTTLGSSANNFSIAKLRCNALGFKSDLTRAKKDYAKSADCYQSLVSAKQNGWVYYSIAATLAGAGEDEAALKPLRLAAASSARLCQKHVLDPIDGKEFQEALKGEHAPAFREIVATIDDC